MNITTASETEIDHQIAEIEARAYAAMDKISEHRRRANQLGRRASLSEAAAKELEQLKEIIAASNKEAREIRAERAPFDAEFSRRGGWNRYFIVEHLHTNSHCSSFRPTTRVGWIPEHSGRSAEEMIEEAGDLICTLCVPDAPVAGKRPTIEALATKWDKAHSTDQCPGSGTRDWKDGKVRTGYMSGNGGTCIHCGNRVANTSRSSQVIRKHKP